MGNFFWLSESWTWHAKAAQAVASLPQAHGQRASIKAPRKKPGKLPDPALQREVQRRRSALCSGLNSKTLLLAGVHVNGVRRRAILTHLGCKHLRIPSMFKRSKSCSMRRRHSGAVAGLPFFQSKPRSNETTKRERTNKRQLWPPDVTPEVLRKLTAAQPPQPHLQHLSLQASGNRNQWKAGHMI